MLRAEKKSLRAKYKAIRRAILPDEKAALDTAICRHLLDSASYHYTARILTYAALADEPETRAFIRAALAEERELYLPKCESGGIMHFYRVRSLDELQSGMYGIAEPCDGAEMYAPREGAVDLCLVPGVCFDEDGYRIGYGKGYYDRFLAHFSGISVGITYERCLISGKLPREKRYDRHVDVTVTEKGVKPLVGPKKI